MLGPLVSMLPPDLCRIIWIFGLLTRRRKEKKQTAFIDQSAGKNSILHKIFHFFKSNIFLARLRIEYFAARSNMKIPGSPSVRQAGSRNFRIPVILTWQGDLRHKFQAHFKGPKLINQEMEVIFEFSMKFCISRPKPELEGNVPIDLRLL